jgi:hypothetical protein
MHWVQGQCENWMCTVEHLLLYMDAMYPGVRATLLPGANKALVKAAAAAGQLRVSGRALCLLVGWQV